MKILFVAGLYPFNVGGAEMQARIIAEAFRQEGHEISYLCYGFNPEHQDLPFDVYSIPKKKSWDVLYLTTKRHIENTLTKINPDCIYHTFFVPFSVYVCDWAREHRVPFYFHSADVYTLQRKNDSLRNIVLNNRLRRLLIKANGIICQNEEQFNLIRRHREDSVRIIYNVHKANEAPIALDRHAVVWIGKGEPIKQLELFLDFAEAKIPLAGRSDCVIFSSRFSANQYGNSLRNRITRLGVTCYEGKDNTFINDFLCRKARVLVNTSVSEGISNTYIQAWMRGIPVVSLNSNPDHWFDSHEIGTCCNGDIGRLHSSILAYLSGSDREAQDVGKKCIEFADSFFSENVVIPQMLDFMQIR